MDIEPATKKRRTSSGSSVTSEKSLIGLTTACFSHIGRRTSLEDVHLVLGDTELKQQFSFIPMACRVGLYAVLDGHGGAAISEAVARILPGHIMNTLNHSGKFRTTNKAVTKALEIAFQLTENEINGLAESANCGCCAVVALVVNNIVHIANLGDSKAVLCRQLKTALSEEVILKKNIVSDVDVSGPTSFSSSKSKHSFPWNRSEQPSPPPVPAESVSLTIDHRPSVPSEKSRVVACGGLVENGRIYSPADMVSGGRHSIGVARSFGDRVMKRYTPRPPLVVSTTQSSLLIRHVCI
jgi:serine/threonine protein phosphatase PrpC